MSKSLATKNVAAILVAVALVFGFAFSFASTAKADTLSDLQAQVQALLAQIAAMQGGSASQQAGGLVCPAGGFTQTLTIGSTGSEVMALQKFLNSVDGTQLATTGAGSPGNETSYFGSISRAAVSKFQGKYGITPTAGYWGPISRAKGNSLCAGSTSGPGPVTPTGPGITVMAAAQPANSLAPAGASRVPFTSFTLTNNTGSTVTINGISVQRTGLAQDAAFSGVVLVDNSGQQVGISRTFNSNHQATVGDTFILNPGQTVTYTVAGNMTDKTTMAAYTGQVASISVIGVNTSVPVNGSLPISGAQQTLNNTLTVGSASAQSSSFDPASAKTNSIGDTAVKFSAIRLQAGSVEDLKLYSVRFRMNGSASATDLSNLAVVINGTSYAGMWSADGRYVSAVVPGGVLVAKGNSIDVYIQGDITGSNASGRVVEFDVDKSTDVYIVGQLYGYGIIPTISSFGTISALATHPSNFAASNSANPWFQGSTITIQGGTVTTIQNATSVAAQNIAINVPNQPLGGFSTNFSGEPVTVQKLIFDVSTSSNAAMLTNVSIVSSSGAVVAGPVDQSGTTLTFNDSVTFPLGSATYTLKGTVSTQSSRVQNGDTYQLMTTPSSEWTSVTGQSTGNTVSLTGFGQISMNTMTVQGLALTAAASSQPASQIIVAGGQSVVFSNIQLDASASGEDVRVNSVPIDLVTGGASSLSFLTSCQLFDSGNNALNYGANIMNSIASSTVNTFNLNNSLTAPKGTVVTLSLKCNVASNAAGTYKFGVNNVGSPSMTISGVTSGNSGTATLAVSSSGTMTISASTLAVTVDASSPTYTVASGGTNGVTVGVVKLRPASEAMTLQKLGLIISVGSVSDVGTVYLYNGSTLLGTALFTGNATTATSTLQTQLTLPADTDTLVTVKANLSDIGTSQSGIEGDTLKIDPSSAEAVGQSSGQTRRVGATPGVAGLRVYNTFPTVAQGTLTGTGMADGRLIRFSVTADSHDNVGLGTFTFKVSTTSPGLVQSVQLFGFTGSDYASGPITSGAANGGQIGNTLASIPNNASFTITPNTSPVEVPAGSTYYFELRGAVTGGTNANVLTTLVGDTNTAPVTGVTTYAGVTGNLIWSPNATGTAATSTGNDWTNGFSIVGLPSSGIFQSRSN